MHSLHKIILGLIIILPSHLVAQIFNMANGTQNVCAGTFYDNGGLAANYTNTNFTETFCSNAGNCLQMNFTAFHTQAGNDELTIYDGPNTASPIIGVYSGQTSPGLVVSSTGCLTFQFTCQGAGTRPGWAATISCSPCFTGLLISTMASTVSTCAANFYDSGGPSVNYAANQNYTKTICSSSPGNCVQAIFTQFDVKSGDLLNIYDAATANAAFLIGSYSAGTINPPPVILSSNAGGCLTFNFTSNASNQGAGWTALMSCDPCPTAPAGVATYTQPTTGQQNAYVGTNMVNTCSGTFTDNGGVASNYSTFIGYPAADGIYRTFCPNQAGKCMRVQFYSFSTEAGFDWLSIRNGPTQYSPEFGAGSTFWGAANPNNYQGCMANGLGPFTSTDQSGCLTFSFYSDNTVTAPGWVATFNCVPCNYGPNGIDNSDCLHSTAICTNLGFNDASTGPGIVSDGGGGCVLAENFSNWYSFKMQTGGTVGLTIVPNVVADDYDFALYGPNVSCATLGSPIRCSYSSGTGNTGMNNALNLSTNTAVCGFANNGSDNIEDVCGNGWTNTINVLAGQTYYLLVNKWSPGGSGFTLNWALSNGASLDCTPLPVEWLSFEAISDQLHVALNWTTATEINAAFYEIEKSIDGKNFFAIGKNTASGNSNIVNEYHAFDFDPYSGISFYRIKQVDKNGNTDYSKTVTVNYNSDKQLFTLEPNPLKEGEKLKVKISGLNNEEDVISIIDLKGIQQLSFNVSLLKGINNFTIDISTLTKGIYLVQLKSNTTIKTQKLVVE